MRWTRTRIGLAIVAGLLVVAVAGGGLYFELGQGPDEAALSSVEADPQVTVERTDAGVLVRSGSVSESTTGIVLYPGGRIEPESYVPTAAELAVRGDVAVVIPEMPLNLAILDVDRADEAMDSVPEIDRWYVGGHSLGGVSACRFAAVDPDRVEGVILLASYCDQDVSGSQLRVLSVLGTADGVLDPEAERESRELLPSDARIVEVEGMNHAQFGAYGTQRGDGEATIDDREARERLAEETVRWLDTGRTDE